MSPHPLTAREPLYDVAGIGAGPFNLSVAALAHEFTGLRSVFFDKRDREALWYENMLIPGSSMQTSYLKDLVSYVAPNSVHSFLMYMKAQGRLYQLIHSEFEYVPRKEFASYLRWVSSRLPNVRCTSEVTNVGFCQGAFHVHTNAGPAVRARHLVVGTGRVPVLPDCVRPHAGQAGIVKGLDYLKDDTLAAARTVAVVGSGQTGAEIFLDLAQRADLRHLSRIAWVSRRENLYPLDASPFVNEQFLPGYVEYFHSLDEATRKRKLAQQKYASDGISARTLREVYQCLYQRTHLHNETGRYLLLPGRELRGMNRDPRGAWELSLWHGDAATAEPLQADVVILATGLEAALPACLDPLLAQHGVPSQKWRVRPDFSLETEAFGAGRIYLQNLARESHGIADPNLSLASWRSGVVLNSILGAERFDTGVPECFMQWAPMGTSPAGATPPAGSLCV